MGRNFKLNAKLPERDTRFKVRVALGVLLLANLAAGYFVFRPLGGSPEELENRLVELRNQVQSHRSSLERLKLIAAKVEKGRSQGDRFMADYFLARRTAYSTLAAELARASQEAGIRPKEHAIAEEPIEGSDNLTMLTINANYEGTYADLVHFVNVLDRSPKFLIVEGLSASPQQSGGMLNVNLKINAFVREEGR